MHMLHVILTDFQIKSKKKQQQLEQQQQQQLYAGNVNVPSYALALLGVILVGSLSSTSFWLGVLGTRRYVKTFTTAVHSHCL